MKILIAKQNQDIFKEHVARIKFIEASKNTCYFTLSTSKFKTLYNKVKEKGYNPYALMFWTLG